MTPEPFPTSAIPDDDAPENPFEAQLQEGQLQQDQNAFETGTESPIEAQDKSASLLSNSATSVAEPAVETRTIEAAPIAGARAPRGRSAWPWLLPVTVVLGAGGYFFKLRREAEALDRRDHAPLVLPDRMAHVPANWSAQTLASRLEKSHKILSIEAFREAATQVGLQDVAPGAYYLPAMASPLDLARAFKAGPTHRDVTFPEGFTAQQFAARLRKNGVAGADKMVQIPPAQLEGKLFPATYEVPLSAPAPQLVQLFEARWQSEMAKLPRPFPTIKGKEMTPIQVVTLASIVERETNITAEMPLVAGALINRLRRPMRLQVDATIQYARLLANQGHKTRLSFQDLEIKSPYNTYHNDGLPPTPICNPGAAALLAAALPTKTDALFYVYSPRLKRHLFATDFEGHKHNIAITRHERDALAAGKTD